MKRTIFLHIGLEKTGSTTLQAMGAANRDLLRTKGILYPSSAGSPNHTRLALYASSGATLQDVRQIAGLGPDRAFAEFQQDFPDLLRQEIEESGCARVWLSNEHLSSRVRTPSELWRLAHLLKTLATDIRIIVYIRHQPDLLVSQYSTKIRSGNVGDVSLPRSEKDYYFNFARLLQRWSSVWGKAALEVRIFDRGLLKDGDIVKDFFGAIGVELDSQFQRPSLLNQSLDSHALQFLRLFNKHVPRLTGAGLNPEYGQIASLLAAASSGPEFRLPPAAMRHVAELFEPSNRLVAETYFGNARQPLFAARDYPESSEDQTPTLADAQALGLAALTGLDKQIAVFEKRLNAVNSRPPPAGLGENRNGVLHAATIEEAAAATARLWQTRQRRLQQLRHAASGRAADAT